MLEIMSDLDNYTDDAHCIPFVSGEIANRICSGQGVFTVDNYVKEINTMFAYINNLDYEILFESWRWKDDGSGDINARNKFEFFMQFFWIFYWLFKFTGI